MPFISSIALIAVVLSGILLMLGFSDLAMRLFVAGILIAFLAPAIERLFSFGSLR